MPDLLSSWLSENSLNNVSMYKGAFVAAKPFKHIIIDNFLDEKKASALFSALKKEPFHHRESDLFSLNQTNDLETSTNELLKSFYLTVGSEEFAQWMASVTGIRVKPGALDLAGSLYQSGDYLLCHDDQLEDRRIAYILYLSKDFEEKDGARFVIFDSRNKKPATAAAHYLPTWNSLMIFEVSAVSFHMVEENLSKKDRYAIGGWLH
jgi:Rps23 Pro-64 3,4-dihydroxylase Tpa1-like proline 4-hydroxylase